MLVEELQHCSPVSSADGRRLCGGINNVLVLSRKSCSRLYAYPGVSEQNQIVQLGLDDTEPPSIL